MKYICIIAIKVYGVHIELCLRAAVHIELCLQAAVLIELCLRAAVLIEIHYLLFGRRLRRKRFLVQGRAIVVVVVVVGNAVGNLRYSNLVSVSKNYGAHPTKDWLVSQGGQWVTCVTTQIWYRYLIILFHNVIFL
jgi:hypothetical protein